MSVYIINLVSQNIRVPTLDYCMKTAIRHVEACILVYE